MAPVASKPQEPSRSWMSPVVLGMVLAVLAQDAGRRRQTIRAHAATQGTALCRIAKQSKMVQDLIAKMPPSASTLPVVHVLKAPPKRSLHRGKKIFGLLCCVALASGSLLAYVHSSGKEEGFGKLLMLRNEAFTLLRRVLDSLDTRILEPRRIAQKNALISQIEQLIDVNQDELKGLHPGAPGDDGKRGPPGKEGPQGKRGSKGPPGPPGAVGELGSLGAEGNQGSPGTLGEQGSVGAAGKVGQQGLPGPDGKQGLPGPDGNQGHPGLNGKQGPPGIDGNQGGRGLCGADGKQGSRGADGKEGLRGPDGKQGPPGANGLPGPDGKQGPPGADGNRGPPGADGKQGERGPPGADGKQGERGPPGPPGADGRQGERGLPPRIIAPAMEQVVRRLPKPGEHPTPYSAGSIPVPLLKEFMVTLQRLKIAVPACKQPNSSDQAKRFAHWTDHNLKRGERVGECQKCKVQIQSFLEGPQCSNSGHWIHWHCMMDELNWNVSDNSITQLRAVLDKINAACA